MDSKNVNNEMMKELGPPEERKGEPGRQDDDNKAAQEVPCEETDERGRGEIDSKKYRSLKCWQIGTRKDFAPSLSLTAKSSTITNALRDIYRSLGKPTI